MIRTQHWDWGMLRHRSYRLRLWSMVKINKPGRKIITFMMLLLDPLYWIHKFWTRQLQIHPMLMYCREIDRYASSISKLHTERWPKPHSLVLYAIMAISKHYCSTKLDNHSQYCDSEHFFTENKGGRVGTQVHLFMAKGGGITPFCTIYFLFFVVKSYSTAYRFPWVHTLPSV